MLPALPSAAAAVRGTLCGVTWQLRLCRLCRTSKPMGPMLARHHSGLQTLEQPLSKAALVAPPLPDRHPATLHAGRANIPVEGSMLPCNLRREDINGFYCRAALTFRLSQLDNHFACRMCRRTWRRAACCRATCRGRTCATCSSAP